MAKALFEIYNQSLKTPQQREYDNYIFLHVENVQKAFEEHFVPYMKDEIGLVEIEAIRSQLAHHDDSKWSEEEYQPYVDKFYPDGSKTEEEIHDSFAKAWLHHLHNNQHHPQYWYLRNDTDHDEDRMLDMEYNYIVEMLCDWGSFYYMNEEKKPGINPNSTAHDWYNEHGKEFGFSDKTKDIIEDILTKCPEL